jgi:hypothetical protein
MEDNRRRYTRVGTENSATLIFDHKDYPVAIEDISINGALVDCDIKAISPDPHNQKVKLFWFLSEDFPALLIHGEVRWSSSNSVGVEFTDLPEETKSQLYRFLELNLKDASSFDRELDQLKAPAEN